MKKATTSTIVTMALLIALEVILTRFLSIQLPLARLGLGFLPVAIMGMMYGPLWAGIGYAVGDLLGVFLFSGAPFHPGFTLTAFLTGVTYGLILYKKPLSFKRVFVAALCVLALYTVCLNTFWLTMVLGKGFLVLLPTRLVQAAIMLPIQVLFIMVIGYAVVPNLPQMRST